MIPRTFPSTFAANGQQQMVVYSLPSITGLTAWIDYIPVKGVTTESATLENTYANGGYQVVDSLASLTGKQAWLDYIPVYEDASYTKPWSTDAGGYIPTSALAALLLDFTSGRLDPRITFSRTTNATLTNSAGLVANAPMNLLTFSEQFDNTAWGKDGATIAANAITAPDGTTTADKINETATTAAHVVYPTVALLATAAQYTASIYVQAAERTFARLDLVTGSYGLGSSVNVNLGTGVVTIRNYGGTTGTTASVTEVGNGWFRLSLTVTATAASYFFQVGPAASSTATAYAGTAGSGIYVWGAQLELGSTATTYNPTTVKNLLGFTEHFDNAAWTKSNAFVQTNLLTYSQDFDNAAWTKSDVSVTNNQTVAPDSTDTADLISELGTVNNHFVQSTPIPLTSGTAYTLSVFLKKGIGATAPDVVQMTLPGAAFGTSQYANYNISTGQVIVAAGGALASISNVGNGWYKLSYTATATATLVAGIGGVVFVNNNPAATRVPSYLGNTASNIYIWGAQLVQGTSAGDYKATYATAAAVGYTDIYGQPFAQKLVPDATSNNHWVFQSVTTTAAPYTATVYMKAGEYSWGLLRLRDSVGDRFAWFNLATGVVGTVQTNLTATITSVGNGWYRCSATIASAIAGTNPVVIGAVSADNTTVYTGDGTSGIYIFGAQLSDSASVDPYVYNPVAVPTAQAYYGPRFDYDPVTLAPKGLLIEEQRTNLVTFSEQFDNAAWTKTSTAVTSNSTVAPDGTTTADTLVGTGSYPFIQGSVTYTAAAYTFSVFVKKSTGTFALAFSAAGAIDEVAFNLATGATTTAGANITSSGYVDQGLYWRVWAVSTRTAVISQPRIFTGYPTNVSPVVWGAQLEAGAFATSYIPTVASQVTRAADSASMIGNNFARWYNVNEGTVYSQFAIPFNGTNMAIWQVYDTLTSRWGLNVLTDNTFSYDFSTGSAGSQTGFARGVSQKVSVAIKAGATPSEAANGVLATSTGAFPVSPAPTSTFYIGSRSVDLKLSGTISRIAYYPRRLSNTELQGITS